MPKAASFYLDEARTNLRVLIGAARASSGSKMLAYADVGRRIGQSPDWVRKFAAGSGDVTVNYPTGCIIGELKAAYDRLCARIENAAAREAALAAAIQLFNEQRMAGRATRMGGAFHAAVAGDLGMVAGAPAAARGAAAGDA